MKGMPTTMNLRAMFEHLNGRTTSPLSLTASPTIVGQKRASNRVQPTDAAHLRRCVKFGLLAVEGTELVLTELGENAMCGYAWERGLAAAHFAANFGAWLK